MYNVNDKITFKIKVDNEIISLTGKVCQNGSLDRYYLFFPPNHTTACNLLRNSISNFNDLIKTYKGNNCTAFPEFNTLEQLELFVKAISIGVLKELNNELIQTKITKNNDKTRLQSEKASISRGAVTEGGRVCSGRCKIAVVFGHLSNKACYC